MPRRKKNIRHHRERVLLSDVLPYEVPLSFTNRHYYNFIIENMVACEAAQIVWKEKNDALNEFIHILFSLPRDPARLTTENRQVSGKQISFKIYKMTGGNPATKPERFLTPFGYKINHKKNEFRELTVPHPRNQMNVVEFYDRCKETIVYYTSISDFSIRRPAKIASHRFIKDRLHYERLADGETIIEEHGKEYENLKSFFVYKDVSNIYKFYESYQYHRCEKKYNKLMKLDISKCFDSIYTHSITWAVLGKEAIKENLNESKASFAGQFDALMQRMHYGETNGIIIGPEFSRIFAEVILQKVDADLKTKLFEQFGLSHKVHYEIFRYVDDYFVFCNNDIDSQTIVEELQHLLKEYKLYLNSSKAMSYEKPIITEITIAKNEITNLLSDKIKLKLEEITDDNGEKVWKGSIQTNSTNLITAFKSIIKTSQVEYKDLLNYSLSIIERRIEKVLKDYSFVENRETLRPQLIKALSGILEFVFFVYSVSPKVNTTIRLCRILRVICSFLKACSREDRLSIHKQIYDEINFILKKNKQKPSTQVETLYLLISLSELGKEFWLDEAVLKEYLGIDTNCLNGKKHNYFSITVALFYIKNKVRYNVLRANLEKMALDKITGRKDTSHKDAEMIMLALDLISCPYISESTKRKAMSLFDVQDASMQSNILNYVSDNGNLQLWFTNWSHFDFGKELDAKQSQEVY